MDMDRVTAEKLRNWAGTYNDRRYFEEDPIAFPRHFAEKYRAGLCGIADVEIAAVIAAHLAWGRRSMIVRDCRRALDEMGWKPYDYVMRGSYRDEDCSLHRTVKWCEFAKLCANLRAAYSEGTSLEKHDADWFRTRIYGQKSDLKAANKKINMMRRWMVRNDGKVDLGVWKDSDPRELVIPLDVHVYTVATELGLTQRRSQNLLTAMEITDSFREIFPDDPCLGDFALFGYGVSRGKDSAGDAI